MPSGVYKRTPEMKTGKYKRTSEHNAINSKSKKGILRSPEHCAAISKAKTGVRRKPRTPEHGDAISEGLKNSDAAKAHNESMRGVPRSSEHIAAIKKGQEESGANDKMRGGDDIVTHHYIYDESDLSKNTAQMTRSDHARLHALLRKFGYIVPRINVTK